MHRAVPFALALLLSGLPAAASAAGAWQTFIRAYTYNDLLADTDTLWCATGEAGLLRYSRVTGTFDAFHREPGGLASNFLSALARDRSGRLWVGTQDAGVSRLSADGRTWTLLSSFDGVPSADIRCLEADGDTVWIGTAAGIALWNGAEIAGTLPDGVNPSPFASDVITGIARVGDSLWVCTPAGIYVSRVSSGLATWTSENDGLFTAAAEGLAYDGTSLIAHTGVRTYRLDEGAGAWSFVSPPGFVERLSDDNGAITLSASDGVYRWNGSGWTLLDAGFTSPQNGDLTRTWSAAIDPSGRAWAAQRDGLREELPGGGFASHLPPQPPGNNMTNLALSGARVYIATISEGVGRLDAGGWQYWFPGACASGCDTTFLNPNFTFALFVDRDGRKWLSAWETAIERIDDSSFPTQVTHYWDGLADSAAHTRAATGLADSRGGVWLGMDTPDIGTVPPLGLDYYLDGAFVRNFRPENTPEMAGGKIKALAIDDNDRLYVGYSGEGLATFDYYPPNSNAAPAQIANTADLVVQSLEVHGNDLWALTTIGLVRYTRSNLTSLSQRDTFELPAGAQNVANDPLAVAADGTVYCGTTLGMRVYRPNRSFTDYTRANSPLAEDDVRAISIEPGTGYVWIATAGGLHRFDPGYVDPGQAALPSLSVRVWPNPAVLTGIGASLRLSGDATSYRGEIYDLNGRRMRRFASDDGAVFWDGRDDDGRLVRPGVYFVLARAGGREAVARVAVIR
jgi:ligand-binding sensor domain-containing protein